MKEYEESINEPKLIFEMRSFVIFGHLRSAELDAICWMYSRNGQSPSRLTIGATWAGLSDRVEGYHVVW